MKFFRNPLFLLILAAMLLLIGGCSKHYVDVYINGECAFVTMSNGKAIDPLWFFPGDYVTFTNISDDLELYLEFPAGMFEVDKTDIIMPGHRATFKVIASGPMEGEIAVLPDCPIGNPTAKIGEEP